MQWASWGRDGVGGLMADRAGLWRWGMIGGGVVAMDLYKSRRESDDRWQESGL